MPITDYYSTITVLSKTTTADNRGGKTYVWASSGTFSGLINQADSKEIEAAAKLGIEASHKLYCPVSVSISNKNLLKVGTRYYRIVSDPKNTVGRSHHYKIFLRETSLDPEG
jgi:SPP1 family predicted phage head-tail adaptor